MKVIVAGLYKTGTKSMKEALKILGYNVWDYREQLNWVEGGIEAWERLLEENNSPKQSLQNMFKYCEAVTDGPAALLSVELSRAFPESKIILCVRDVEEWFESYSDCRNTLNQNPVYRLLLLLSPTVRRRSQVMRLINDAICCGRFLHPFFLRHRNAPSPILSKRAYLSHVAYVIHSLPKDRVLIFNVKEGWSPLCSFLEKDIPNCHFPHVNQRQHNNASMSAIFHDLQENAFGRNSVLLETFVVFIFVVLVTCCTCYRCFL
ncbi:unnamed protein product [Clavelina lepadiformis]|uniref:Sulfotransferase n=1 Tax=Clavelina lepadiformis TaxID=159417 RepID=A0ABP0GGP0_CLALP